MIDRPLSLNEIRRRTGISYPALLRYKRQLLARKNGAWVGPLAKFVVMKGNHVRFDSAVIPLFLRQRRVGLAKRGRPPIKKAKRR